MKRIKEFLEKKLGIFSEKYTENMGFGEMLEGERKILCDGEIKLSNGDFLGVKRVWIDRGRDISKTVYFYRRAGKYCSEGAIPFSRVVVLIENEILRDKLRRRNKQIRDLRKSL